MVEGTKGQAPEDLQIIALPAERWPWSCTPQALSISTFSDKALVTQLQADWDQGRRQPPWSPGGRPGPGSCLSAPSLDTISKPILSMQD